MFSNIRLSNEVLGGDIDEDIYYERQYEGGQEEFINQQDGSESDTSSSSDLESDDDIMAELEANSSEEETEEMVGGSTKDRLKKFKLPNIY